MLGTFGLRPKGTLSARALGLASVLQPAGWRVQLATTPWDNPRDAGQQWCQDGVMVRNTRATHPALWPFAVGQLRRWVRRSDAGLVHLFKPKGFGDLAARLLRANYPVVVDMDDWEGDGGWNQLGDYGRTQRRLFDWQERSWPPQADAVTVASRELERRALDLGAPAERVHYLPNGLSRRRVAELRADPAGRAPARAALGLGDGPLILLYTRFVEFDPALIAPFLFHVLQTQPAARLIVVGGSSSGTAEAVVRRGARQAGIADHIHWLGWIAPDDLPTIAAASDIAIHPFADTPINRAKCSVKLLELMASGLPVVSTQVGENNTFIEDGRSGLLATRCDSRELAQLALDLLADPAWARHIGHTARDRVEADFLWETLCFAAVAAYEQALGAWGKRARTRP